MGILSNITKNCRQTAVYWGNPTKDTFGGITWDDPVEISCRWENIIETVTMQGEDNRSIEYVAKAAVYVLQDLDEEGCLFLGELDDLDSSEEVDPESNSVVYRIKRFDKIPALGNSSEFIRKAYL
jgi:hypothetical protein